MRVLINMLRPNDDVIYRSVHDAIAALGAEVVKSSVYPDQKEQLIEAAQGCEAMVIMQDAMDEATFSALPDLKLCIRYGAGIDSIDLKAATDHGVAVANSPGNSAAVAEGAFALMLALSRDILHLDNQLRSGTWRPVRMTDAVIRKNVGVIGFGRIGRKLCELLKGFNTRVLVYDAYVKPDKITEMGYEPATLDQIASESDYISIHAPATEETYHIVDHSFISKMKKTAYLINTSRGSLVNQQELILALREKRIKGAALDVFENEPVKVDDPILTLDNVILTPHAMSATEDTAYITADLIADYIAAYMENGSPKWAINQEVLPSFGK